MLLVNNKMCKKMRKKVFLKLFMFVLITSAIVLGVNIKMNGSNVSLLDISLSNIEILAKGEGGGDCPGGSCSYTDAFGSSCSACCPNGKDPECNSLGCRCQ